MTELGLYQLSNWTAGRRCEWSLKLLNISKTAMEDPLEDLILDEDQELDNIEVNDDILKVGPWMEESAGSATLNSLLASRLDYVQRYVKTQRSFSSKNPPESWFVKDSKTVIVPRLYPPFYGYPVIKPEERSLVAFHLGCTADALRSALDRIRDSASCWTPVEAKAFKFGPRDSLNRVAKCYLDSRSNDLTPIHAFDSTAVAETLCDVAPFWKLIYSGITDSSRHTGLYGVLHDNTLLDVRPFEDGYAATEQTDRERYDYSLRDNCKHLKGFVDCIYTPTSLEAGRIRSIVHGVRFRMVTDSTLSSASALIQIACQDAGQAVIRTDVTAELEDLISDDSWIFHFCGVTMPISSYTAVSIISHWLSLIGPSRPSLHTFPKQRVLSMAVTPGCLVRPVSVLSAAQTPMEDRFWIDSTVFRSKRMMSLYGYDVPPVSDALEYCKSFAHLVPYCVLDDPPRPLLASGMSTQALCLPRTEMMSTVTPRNRVDPLVQTPLMSTIASEIEDSTAMSIPGFPLLVAYINMRGNYEDSIIVSSRVADLGVFDHDGYVSHPLPSFSANVRPGSRVGEGTDWFRPADQGQVLLLGESQTKSRFATVKMKQCKLRVGDKIATQHGQKFTISQILSEDELPTCIDTQTGVEFKPHVVVAASSVHNRGTLGQIYESWLGFDRVRRYDFDPKEQLEPVIVTEFESGKPPDAQFTCTFREPGETQLVTRLEPNGDRVACLADYGIAHFWLLCHLARDKQHYLSTAPKGPSIGRGRLQGKPVRFGEMELITLASTGLTSTLSELTESFDLVEVPICSVCRRLSLLCDCAPGTDRDLTPIATRLALVKVDVCQAVYSMHLGADTAEPESEFEAEAKAAAGRGPLSYTYE